MRQERNKRYQQHHNLKPSEIEYVDKEMSEVLSMSENEMNNYLEDEGINPDSLVENLHTFYATSNITLTSDDLINSGEHLNSKKIEGRGCVEEKEVILIKASERPFGTFVGCMLGVFISLALYGEITITQAVLLILPMSLLGCFFSRGERTWVGSEKCPPITINSYINMTKERSQGRYEAKQGANLNKKRRQA